jgi:ubiquinone/menaquinone biosynthesis C-methylase UbiE
MKNYSDSKSPTSWQNVSTWYSNLVNDDGHYFHQKVIIPKIKQLIDLNQNSSVLDLGCGQGIFERQINPMIYYQGIDASKNLIKNALEKCTSTKHHFITADITRPIPISKFDFTHALIILALQNIEFPEKTIENVNKHLIKNGKLFLVINHPCFRIPKNSSWDIDMKNKIQYRRIDKYLSNIKIPIIINPGLKDKSPINWSFHHSLSSYSQMLNQNGFVIEKIEEWISDKKSVGKNAEMENIARSEFPLFMTIIAQKI